jgi:hypothetical protein
VTHTKLQTTKYCFACGKETTNGKLVMFIPRMETYCKDISTCNAKESHIYTQIAQQPYLSENQSKPVPCRYEDIFEESQRYFGPNSAEHETLFKIIGKPSSVRLDTHKAMFLAKYMREHNFDTHREAFYHMVDRIMLEDQRIVKKEFIAKR